jgi:L-fuconolactonase
MNSFSLVDAHVHLWDVDRHAYPWLVASPTLNQSYGIDRFEAERGDIEVDKIVFIECTGFADHAVAREEVRWVEALAQQSPRLQAMVAHAPLEQGDAVRPHLEWLTSQPLVRGVRRLLQDEAPEFCLKPCFVAGVRLLAEFDFTFDVCIYHHQLPQAIDLIQQCPEVRFVLDHMGKPAIRKREMDPWRAQIRTLAECPNVVCKLSGALTEARTGDDEKEIQPYLEHAIQTFGCDRVMFGGD